MSVTFPDLAKRTKSALDTEDEDIDITEEDLRVVLKIAVREIGSALSVGEDVYLEGFGRFYPHLHPPRKVNYGLGEEQKKYKTGVRATVRFNPFTKLRDEVHKYLKDLNLDNLE